MFVTVETYGGDTAVVAVAQITHLVNTGMGTQINFTSGESIIASKSISELTLDLMRAAS